jgi:hypothetical protein
MTAVVSIDTASGAFRRYRSGPGGRPVMTHEVTLEEGKWMDVLLGKSDFDMPALENFRQAIGCEDARTNPDPGTPSPQPPKRAA